jgi:hypothetical protein
LEKKIAAPVRTYLSIMKSITTFHKFHGMGESKRDPGLDRIGSHGLAVQQYYQAFGCLMLVDRSTFKCQGMILGSVLKLYLNSEAFREL